MFAFLLITGAMYRVVTGQEWSGKIDILKGESGGKEKEREARGN